MQPHQHSTVLCPRILSPVLGHSGWNPAGGQTLDGTIIAVLRDGLWGSVDEPNVPIAERMVVHVVEGAHRLARYERPLQSIAPRHRRRCSRHPLQACELAGTPQ